MPPDRSRTPLLYVFDSTVDEFRPATLEEIDEATNVSTYAQDAVRYHTAIERIFRDRREPDKVTGYCLFARPDLVETAAESRKEAP